MYVRRDIIYGISTLYMSCSAVRYVLQEAGVGCFHSTAHPGSDVGSGSVGCEREHDCLHVALHCLQLTAGAVHTTRLCATVCMRVLSLTHNNRL